MNAARIPVRGFHIEDCDFYGWLEFVTLKKQVVKICFILHISEFPHFFGDFITLTIGASMNFWSVCLTGQFESYKNYVIGAVDGGEGVCSRTLEDIGGEGD